MPTKRRIRSPHPGVKLKKRVQPSGRINWRAHFVDPATGKEIAVSLDANVCGSKEARRRWAIAKAQDLSRSKLDAAAGIVTKKRKGVALPEAIRLYFDGPGAVLKPKTLSGHRSALAHFEVWAGKQGLQRTSDLSRAGLLTLKEHLVAIPKSLPKAGRRRPVRTKVLRSPMTVNRELRSLKAVFGYWRQRDLLPQLHKDDIADGLKALSVPYDAPDFLKPAQLRKLLDAAVRHDADTFSETREEHRGKRDPGTTTRYQPIAPFVAFVLLAGVRRGEALNLKWSAVDLGALDHEGRVVGEIRLGSDITKTGRARTIGLEVSPGLRRLLAAHRLQQGGNGYVFGGPNPYTVDVVEAARRRLQAVYGAPPFSWQRLRSTCATYLTCSTGIYGAATVFMSAKQLGHSVAVAERHYLGVHRGIPRVARSLEAAMQVEDEINCLGRGVGKERRSHENRG